MSLQLNGTAGVTYNDGSNQPAAASPYGLKNLIINGDFGIWQRGTSVTTTTVAFGNYTADRWASYRQVVATQVFETINSKRKSTGKFTLSGGATELYVYQKIEDGNSLNGEEVTLSFYAKGDSSETFGVLARYYDDATQNNEYTTHSTTISLTTSWTKYTITFTADDNTTSVKRNLFIRFNKSAYGGTFVQLTDVQLEIGTTATPFENRMYGTELALCQRYCQVLGGGQFEVMMVGAANSTSSSSVTYKPPVNFRTTPSMSYSDIGDFQLYRFTGATAVAVTAANLVAIISSSQYVYVDWTASVSTGEVVYLRSDNTTSSKLIFSAEL